MQGFYRCVGRAVALATTVLLSQSVSAQSDYTLTERGLNYNVFQKTTLENGTNRVRRYTELASGLNFTNQYGQLAPSVESITPLEGGGASSG